VETMSLDELSDEELFQRVGRGNQAAFGLLVRRHHGRMMRIAWRIAGDQASAEDIVQEAFTRAWIKAPTWQVSSDGGAARFTTWLTRIVLNLAIDGKRRVQPLRLEAAGQVVAPGSPADTQLEHTQEQYMLKRAVAALPERQRAAIALTYDEGLSNGEAAVSLGTTVGALELLLVRARRSLRESLRPLLRDGT
jgi:RNA polymerase sigma-70 factor (ECF subfamily)